MDEVLKKIDELSTVQLNSIDGQLIRKKAVIEILSEQKEPCECEIAIPLDEWDEDDGNCLWWKFPIEEPPYCGTPLDSEWQERDYDEYYTHFTRFKEPLNQPSTYIS